jgi:hypothetical protein
MKNKIITIVITALVTALVTAAATCVTLSLTKSEPLTDWIKMANMKVNGCQNPEICLAESKRIDREMVAVTTGLFIGIREGVRSAPEGVSPSSGQPYSPTSDQIFVRVTDVSRKLDGKRTVDTYEFDLIKLLDDQGARKQIKSLIIKTNAQSNDFRIKR